MADRTDDIADSTCQSYSVPFEWEGKHRDIATLMNTDMYMDASGSGSGF